MESTNLLLPDIPLSEAGPQHALSSMTKDGTGINKAPFLFV